MLEKLAIVVLLCIVGVLFIWLKVTRRQLREMQQHRDSWRLLAEHQEREQKSW